MLALIVFSFLLIAYAYFGYPLLLASLVKVRGAKAKITFSDTCEAPKLSIVIAAYNEEQAIRAKIEDTLALEWPASGQHEAFEIIVASDASNDRTHEIVEEFSDRGVQLLALAERSGKEFAQRLGVQQASGEIIVFTDAKVRLSPDALIKLAEKFQDESVGVVSSFDVVEGAGSGSGEGFYVRYEMWLRAKEEEFGTLIGLSGSCFAARKELCQVWRDNVPSDFWMLINARKKGLRGVTAEQALCYYKEVASSGAEFSRKVRTVLRGMSTLFSCSEVLNPLSYGSFSWQVLSHKLCRWLVPWFFLLLGFCLLLLAREHWFYTLSFFGYGLFLLAALAAYFVEELSDKVIFKLPLFFLISNAAIGLAWVYFISGKRMQLWEPSKREH